MKRVNMKMTSLFKFDNGKKKHSLWELPFIINILPYPIVLKYSGLLEGKGVVVAKNPLEFVEGFLYLVKLIKKKERR